MQMQIIHTPPAGSNDSIAHKSFVGDDDYVMLELIVKFETVAAIHSGVFKVLERIKSD